jgi:hypothetical protein
MGECHHGKDVIGLAADGPEVEKLERTAVRQLVPVAAVAIVPGLLFVGSRSPI